MSILAGLVTKLREDAVIEPSEGIADAKIEQWIRESIRKHDSTLDLTAIPDEEDEAVTLLAWIQLCYHRASKYSAEASTSGANGYGTDRNTPYYKLMDLAKHLQARYDRVVADSGTPDPS